VVSYSFSTATTNAKDETNKDDKKDDNNTNSSFNLNDSSIMSWGSANSLDSHIFVDTHHRDDPYNAMMLMMNHDDDDDDVVYYDPYLDHNHGSNNTAKQRQERLRARRLLQTPTPNKQLAPPGMMNNMDHSMATTFRSEDAGSGQAVLLASFDSTYRNNDDGERRHSKQRPSSKAKKNPVKLECIDVPETTTLQQERYKQQQQQQQQQQSSSSSSALQSITNDFVNLNVSGTTAQNDDEDDDEIVQAKQKMEQAAAKDRNNKEVEDRQRKHRSSTKSKNQKALHERNYWNKVVEQRLEICGKFDMFVLLFAMLRLLVVFLFRVK